MRVRRVMASVLLLGGCASGPEAPAGTPVTPAGLERFIGDGLTFSERGSFGLDGSVLIDAADAPGGGMVRVAYPAGSASRRAGGEDGGMQA